MNRRTTLVLLAALLSASACAGGSGSSTAPLATESPPPTESTAPDAAEAAAVSPELPGEGVSLTMARADWSSGYFQAAIFRELLLMLGYEVSDPADTELAVNLAYLGMARGDIDFWTNSWYPSHNSWLQNHLPDGTLVGDHVSRIGSMLEASALQGYLIERAFAEEYGITTLDDLDRNPEAIAHYDLDDHHPGDGVVDVFGCPVAWTCDDVMQSQIAFSGWENIGQVRVGYETMFADATARINKGRPAIIYAWTPSTYGTILRPGDNVYWLGIEEVLDDSNPLGLDGGEGFDQRPGVAGIDAEACPAVNTIGECRLGFKIADIVVTARNDLLENHPAAAKLFEVVKLNVVDVSLRILELADGEDPVDLARQWISDNQEQVDAWLEEARAAAAAA